MGFVRILSITLLTWIFLTVFPSITFAAEVIREFNTTLIPKKDGSMLVIEKITYDFGESERHGIFRDIPLVTRVGDLYRVMDIGFLSVKRNGQMEKYTVSEYDGIIQAKVGSADAKMTGSHEYELIYTVENGIGSNYEYHDEIYWNVTGNDWPVSILNASFQMEFEEDFAIRPDRAICFTGPPGSTASECSVPENAPFNPIVITQPLSPGDGFTIVTAFPVGTFAKSILTTKPPQSVGDNDGVIIGLIYLITSFLLNIILAPSVLIWYLLNKRKNRFGKVTVNFDLPKDQQGKRITPAEAGAIDNARLDRDDVIATIFDLAVRKYIRIEEVKHKKKILGIINNDSSDYKLVKLKSFDTQDVNPFERALLDELFKDSDEMYINDIDTDFYKTFNNLEKELFHSLVARGFYTKNPKTQKGLLLVGSIFSFVFLGFLLGGVLLWLSIKLNGRTAAGDEEDWKIDGLKLFLKNMSRNYEWQAKELYIVEKMIPYAMAVGYIDKFMEQLKIIKPDYNPTWYRGNSSFYNIAPVMVSSFNSSITTSAPSSSSGFSGGGSSGGGSGGGGGGSW